MEISGSTKYDWPGREWFSVEVKMGEKTFTIDPRDMVQAFQNFCP